MDHIKRPQTKPGPASGRKEQPKRLHQSSPGHLRPEYSRLQGEGRTPHGGKTTGPGSRDGSPSAQHYPSQSIPTNQLQSQLQQHFADLAAKTPLPELLGKVQNLGFPSSCTFVLNMLERYLKSNLAGEKNSQPGTDTLLALVDTFVLKIPPKLGVKGQKMEGALTPAEEMQLLMSIHSQLEEQQSLEMRYCMFEAIFGGNGGDKDKQVSSSSDQPHETLGKLVSLCVSLESSVVLSCVATWMQSHPSEALSIAKSLYYDFCVLLPDAADPLLQLATHSPTFAQQLTIAFTTLHPFHLIGSTPQGVNSDHLHPPIRMLEIVSHWVETFPEFLFPSKLSDKWSDLPLLRTKKLTPHSKSPLPGLIQWCILAPLIPREQVVSGGNPRHSQKGLTETVVRTTASCSKTPPSGIDDSQREEKFASLVAKLHANILSVILSHSQSFGYRSLVSDDIAVIMATLLAFSQKISQGQSRDSGTGGGGGGGVASMMNESVERLAQFLQITLSCGLLSLNSDDLFSIVSALPQNKLLDLVVSHHQQPKH